MKTRRFVTLLWAVLQWKLHHLLIIRWLTNLLMNHSLGDQLFHIQMKYSL